jgi:serine protein kinase
VLRYLGDERTQLSAKEQTQVQQTLKALERYGYCENCAKDGIVMLLSRRYTD